MSGQPGAWAIRAAVVILYAARPWSCAWVLQLEPRDPDGRYRGIDPHGFGVLGALLSALVWAVPVLWLLLQRRATGQPIGRRVMAARSAAVLLAIGSPMLMQLGYLRLPIGQGWPVIASSLAWFAAVAWLCVHRGDVLPSVHAAFERRPRLAWATLGAIAVAKLTLPVAVLFV